MEYFEKHIPSISGASIVSDHYKFIPFVTSSEDNEEIIYPKTTSRGNLNGDEAKQFYEEVISSRTNCLAPSTDDHSKNPKAVKNVTTVKKSVTSVSDNCRLTIFHHAQNGNVEGIEYFLSKQYDVNTQDMYGWTPLMCATFEGHTPVVEYLLKQGADLNIKNKHGLTALDIAKTKNNKTVIDILENGIVDTIPDVNVDNEVQEEMKYCDLCKCSYVESTVAHERSIAHLFSSRDDNISTYYHISEDNKGFQIMLKKGWDKNKGLGADAKGRKFPIKTVLKTDRSCIGGKKEVPKVTHFGPNDYRSVKSTQPTLNLKREKKLKKSEIKKQERKNRQLEIEFRRQFHGDSAY